MDAGVDAGLDAGADAGVDAGLDAGVEAGLDAGADAGVDAGLDAGLDAGSGPESACGHPGDTGNSSGVGEYCLSSTDCSNQSAVCSSLTSQIFPDAGIPPTYFCTIPGCDPCADAQTTATVCGPNAICACFGGAGCGCAPASCSALVPDGGSCGDAGQ